MKKNQKTIVIAAAVVVLIGAGAFFFLQNKNGSSEGTNVVTSIKDALSKSASMECTYTDEEGRQSKSYIKNGAIRSDYTGVNEEESGSMIVTDKKMYMWNGKEGYMMDIPEVTQSPDQPDASTGDGLSQKEEVLEDLEKYKESCKAAVVSDRLFTPPSDVVFQDYSQYMQQGAGMTEEQIQQYMNQYAPPQE